jgi:flagellar hook-basal body complex protein FliE
LITALNSVNSALSGSSELSVLQPSLRDAGSSSVANTEPFGDLLKETVDQVNHLEKDAHLAVAGLMNGTGVDVHQAMIASEKESMAFEMVLAVRNKAVQSYQSVMSMQF